MPKSVVSDLNVELGQLVRDLRQKRDMTLQELARELDISHQQLQKYEKGSNQISAMRLKQIVQILHAPEGYFSRLFEYEPEVRKASKGFEDEGASYAHDGARALEAEDLVRNFRRLQQAGHRKIILAAAKAALEHERKKAG